MDIIYKMHREMLRRGMSHKTILAYTQCLRQFMKFCPKELMKITNKDITDYLDMLIDRNLSGSTLNVHMNALKFALQEVLHKRVMLKMKFSRVPKQLPVFLTKEEVLRLFSAVDNEKHLLILELLYSAGLRVSEAVKLKAADFDFSRNIGWVRKGKGNKDRPFIIAKCLHEKLKKAAFEANGGWLFEGRRGRHLHIRSVQEAVRSAAKKAGIKKKVHPHSLRHSFATHLIENGYDVAAVQPLMGHSNAQTTMVYVHMCPAAFISVKSPYDDLRKEGGV